MYLKRSIRRGALSKMLSEILETRVLVKSSMKELSFIKVGIILKYLLINIFLINICI